MTHIKTVDELNESMLGIINTDQKIKDVFKRNDKIGEIGDKIERLSRQLMDEIGKCVDELPDKVVDIQSGDFEVQSETGMGYCRLRALAVKDGTLYGLMGGIGKDVVPYDEIVSSFTSKERTDGRWESYETVNTDTVNISRAYTLLNLYHYLKYGHWFDDNK